MKHRQLLWTAIAVSAWLCPAIARAEDGPSRIYEEQMRVKLDEQAPEHRETSIDGGGWFSFALFKYDDPIDDRWRTLRRHELRLWGSASYQGTHRFYVRALTAYDDWNSGDNPKPWHGDEYEDFFFERAWYELDVARALRQGGVETSGAFRIRVGRQLMELGTGLALLYPLDAVRFEGEWCGLEWMAFLAKTFEEQRNIDESAAVVERQRRCFFGGQLRYKGLTGHRPFAYYFYNEDHTDPYQPDPIRASLQSYDYSTHYVGIGSEGSLLLPNLRYSVELVGEMGKTFSEFEHRSQGQTDVCAFAADALLEYYFSHPLQPKIWFEYLFASGDDDRTESSISTVGGNTRGTRDFAFNGFGFRDTGLAYAPEISNLHMWQVGGSLLPFRTQGHRLLKNLEVGSKVYFYSKAADNGGTSDTSITNPSSRWLGWEWDIYMDWRLTSDLSLTVRYGAFQPGAAYADNDECRQFLYAAVTYSF